MDDVVQYICGMITAGSTYKAVCQVNWMFYAAARAAHPRARVVFADHMMCLATRYPRAAWDWSIVFSNPHLTWEAIHPLVMYADARGIGAISRHPAVTMDIVNQHPDIQWDWSSLIRNPNVSIAMAVSDDRFSQHRLEMLKNPNMTLEAAVVNDVYKMIQRRPGDLYNTVSLLWSSVRIPVHVLRFVGTRCHSFGWFMITMNALSSDVIEAPALLWNWELLVSRPDIPIEMFIQHAPVDELYLLSQHDDITMDIVNQYPWIDWGYAELSARPLITIDDVAANPRLKWDWDAVSAKPGVTYEMMVSCRLPLKWSGYTRCPDVTIEFMLAHPDHPWCIRWLSGQPTSWSLVIAWPRKKWRWAELSQVIPWDIISVNLQYPWHMASFSSNRTITWEAVVQHRTWPWVWSDMQHLSLFCSTQHKIEYVRPNTPHNDDLEPSCIVLLVWDRDCRLRRSYDHISQVRPFCGAV